MHNGGSVGLEPREKQQGPAWEVSVELGPLAGPQVGRWFAVYTSASQEE